MEGSRKKEMTIRAAVVGCARPRSHQTETASSIAVTTNNLYSFGRAHEVRRRANVDLYCLLFWDSSVLFLRQAESGNVDQNQLGWGVEVAWGYKVERKEN